MDGNISGGWQNSLWTLLGRQNSLPIFHFFPPYLLNIVSRGNGPGHSMLHVEFSHLLNRKVTASQANLLQDVLRLLFLTTGRGHWKTCGNFIFWRVCIMWGWETKSTSTRTEFNRKLVHHFCWRLSSREHSHRISFAMAWLQFIGPLRVSDYNMSAPIFSCDCKRRYMNEWWNCSVKCFVLANSIYSRDEGVPRLATTRPSFIE